MRRQVTHLGDTFNMWSCSCKILNVVLWLWFWIDSPALGTSVTSNRRWSVCGPITKSQLTHGSLDGCVLVWEDWGFSLVGLLALSGMDSLLLLASFWTPLCPIWKWLVQHYSVIRRANICFALHLQAFDYAINLFCPWYQLNHNWPSPTNFSVTHQLHVTCIYKKY